MKSTRDFDLLAKTLGGIPIWGSLPGSPSAKAGVRYGDILLSVNGMATPTLDAYLAARSSDKPTLTIVVFRDGAELTLKLRLPRRPKADAEAAALAMADHVTESRMLAPTRKKRTKS